jgi:hypothetical protein
MHDTSHDAVIERLTCLERTCRRWQVLGSFAFALLALVALLGAVERRDGEEVEELRARAFVLLDRDGKPRMDLRVAGNDSTHLVLLDREGQPQLSLNILPQGGADLVIRDRQGQPRAALSVVADGRPGLSFYDAPGPTRVSLGVFPDGQTRLVLNDQGGHLRWATP